MRPVVSYDDIAPPPPAASTPAFTTSMNHGGPAGEARGPPPNKKRKRQQHQNRRSYPQHWDDPGAITASSLDQKFGAHGSSATDGGTDTYHDEEEGDEEDEESRELTHQEIWDDSALIDAWNSAAAEYEAFHGPEKDWKSEPVKRSPLWYNKPPAPNPKSKKKQNSQMVNMPSSASHQPNGDSQPLDFNTFVPTHDPTLSAANSLSVPNLAQPPTLPTDFAKYLSESSGPSVSRDEAFSRALGAMYWAGYWTAMYHNQKSQFDERVGGHDVVKEEDEDEDEDEEEENGGDGEDADLVPTQR